jgi:amidohydrolase
VRALAEREVGSKRFVEALRLMFTEDFAFFAERLPACFYAVGCNGDASFACPHHHAKFDMDERALETGLRMMAAISPSTHPRTPVKRSGRGACAVERTGFV